MEAGRHLELSLNLSEIGIDGVHEFRFEQCGHSPPPGGLLLTSALIANGTRCFYPRLCGIHRFRRSGALFRLQLRPSQKIRYRRCRAHCPSSRIPIFHRPPFEPSEAFSSLLRSFRIIRLRNSVNPFPQSFSCYPVLCTTAQYSQLQIDKCSRPLAQLD